MLRKWFALDILATFQVVLKINTNVRYCHECCCNSPYNQGNKHIVA
jgi:hypothetical protein